MCIYKTLFKKKKKTSISQQLIYLSYGTKNRNEEKSAFRK